MQTTTLETLEFNIFKVLHIVENDTVLDEIFKDGDNQPSYNVLRTLAKTNGVNVDTMLKLKEIFTRIILPSKKFTSQYKKLEDVEPKTPKLPKHYGKRRVMEDIEASDTKTELDRTLLALNDLRNIYAKLKARAIKDKLTGTKILTQADCRDIRASVRIIENRVKDILAKK